MHQSISCFSLGHEKVVELLLRNGANIFAANSEGRIPFEIAKANGEDILIY